MEQKKIKYRAWHKEKKKMRYVFAMKIEDTFNGSTDLPPNVSVFDDWCSDTACISCHNTWMMKDVILMQYIGKEDINKKEIYKGDIIIGKIIIGYDKDEDNENGISPSPAQIYKEIKGEVFWDDCKLSYLIREKNANRNLDVFSKYLYSVEEIEVIGNKFENKELLK